MDYRTPPPTFVTVNEGFDKLNKTDKFIKNTALTTETYPIISFAYTQCFGTKDLNFIHTRVLLHDSAREMVKWEEMLG